MSLSCWLRLATAAQLIALILWKIGGRIYTGWHGGGAGCRYGNIVEPLLCQVKIQFLWAVIEWRLQQHYMQLWYSSSYSAATPCFSTVTVIDSKNNSDTYSTIHAVCCIYVTSLRILSHWTFRVVHLLLFDPFRKTFKGNVPSKTTLRSLQLCLHF